MPREDVNYSIGSVLRKPPAQWLWTATMKVASQWALALGFTPEVPPLRTRLKPWAYDREVYKRRNEIERLFRRLKGFRRIFTRFEKLDVLFVRFTLFPLIFDSLR